MMGRLLTDRVGPHEQGRMSKPTHPVWFAAKRLLTVGLVIFAFAVVVPNCIVPATASHPRYFAWSGLIGPFLVSCIFVYCVWFWK